MRKIITIVLYNRPDYTKIVFDRLRKCDGIGDYTILAHLDPGNEEVLAIARSVDFAKVHITLNEERFGIARNTYQAFEHGFRISDFIIHLEDDTVPARDFLTYMEYCDKAYRDDGKVFSAAGYNRSSCRAFQHYLCSRRVPYTCWGVGLWRNRWQWAKDFWSKEKDEYAVSLARKLRRFDVVEIYPQLSRIQNIGVERGMHVPSPEWHRENQHTDHWAGNYDLPPRKYAETGPLVTAVMITGMHSERYRLARAAIACFKNQTYANKELLIINHGDQSLHTGDIRIRELRIVKGKRETVGDLRNLGLKYASGDFIINWDDDDWYHPKRIETQMAFQTEDSAVFLKNRIHYSFKNKCALYNVDPHGAESTILHPKAIDFVYPSMVRSSDSFFSQKFKQRIAVDNDPALYIRFYHGLNLWNDEHIMGHLAGVQSKPRRLVNPNHRRLLNKVLDGYPRVGNGR